jgi:hypothetical protein
MGKMVTIFLTSGKRLNKLPPLKAEMHSELEGAGK